MREKIELYLKSLTAQEIGRFDAATYIDYLEELLVTGDICERCRKCGRLFEYRNMHPEHREYCQLCGAKVAEHAASYCDYLSDLAQQDRLGQLSGEYQYQILKGR